LNGLDLNEFRTLKALASPPGMIVQVFTCVINILATFDDSIEVDKNGKPKDVGWKQAKILMGNPQHLLEKLNNVKGYIDEIKVPLRNFRSNEPILSNPEFTVANILTKSKSVGGLCDWVINITKYFEVVL